MEWSSKKRGLVLQQLLEIITKLVAVFCLLFLSEAAGNIHLDCFTSHFLISQNTPDFPTLKPFIFTLNVRWRHWTSVTTREVEDQWLEDHGPPWLRLSSQNNSPDVTREQPLCPAVSEEMLGGKICKFHF